MVFISVTGHQKSSTLQLQEDLTSYSWSPRVLLGTWRTVFFSLCEIHSAMYCLHTTSIVFACFCISPSVHSETCFFWVRPILQYTGRLLKISSKMLLPPQVYLKQQQEQQAFVFLNYVVSLAKSMQATTRGLCFITFWGGPPGCESVWHLVFLKTVCAGSTSNITLGRTTLSMFDFPHRVHHNSLNKWVISAPETNG